MVGLMIVGAALLAFLLIVALAYLWPGPDQRKPATSPDERQGEPGQRRMGVERPMGPP